MNNIYVDELPKSCQECPYYICEKSEYDGFWEFCSWCGYEFSKETCPLKLITDRLAEERKRVLWEIRKRAKRTQFYIEPTEKSPTGKQKGFIYEFSDRLLDQIEGASDERSN